MNYRIALVTLLAAFLYGCSNNSNPVSSPNPTSSVPTPGEFGFHFNRIAHDSKTTAFSASAIAGVGRNTGYGTTPYLLNMTLDLKEGSPYAPHDYSITLFLPFTRPTTGSYHIASSEDPNGAYVSADIDSNSYGSDYGGAVIITEFDTVDNYVSGKFYFSGYQTNIYPPGNDTTVIDSGYFYRVPISVGSYGQGTISATVNGKPITISNGNGLITADASSGFPGVLVIAFGSSGAGTIQLGFVIPTPIRTGTITMNGVTNTEAVYQYSDNTTDLSIDTKVNASGTMTVTSVDTDKHRFSALFNFSGKDSNTGQTVTVSNGKIDNLLWFDL